MRFGILLIILLFNAAPVSAEELNIGIKEAKPFAYQDGDEWKGLSVELIKRLSQEVGFTYQLIPHDNINTLLEDVERKTVDMSIAAISLTAEREQFLDFSHRYFTTTLGILAKYTHSTWDNIIWIVTQLMFILIIFVVGIYIVGQLENKIDGDGSIKTPHDGAWWAITTFTTVGYGDLAPTTGKGKLFAASWMVSSLFLVSIFTAYVTSSLTVKKLSDVEITTNDLYKVSVITVTDSTASKYLDAKGIKYKAVPTLKVAIDYFNAGHVDVVVQDAPMLLHVSKTISNAYIVPLLDTEEDYGIALPEKSELTERINFGILRILASTEWKIIHSQYNNL